MSPAAKPLSSVPQASGHFRPLAYGLGAAVICVALLSVIAFVEDAPPGPVALVAFAVVVIAGGTREGFRVLLAFGVSCAAVCVVIGLTAPEGQFDSEELTSWDQAYVFALIFAVLLAAMLFAAIVRQIWSRLRR